VVIEGTQDSHLVFATATGSARFDRITLSTCLYSVFLD